MRATSSCTSREKAEDQDLFVRIHSAALLLANPAERAAYDTRRASPHYVHPAPPARTHERTSSQPNQAAADRAYEHGSSRPGKPGSSFEGAARPDKVGPEAEHAAWVAEYDRLVAWFYRREPLL